MTLVFLLIAALAVSALIGFLADLPARELVLQTAALFAGALLFYGIVALL